MTFEYDPRKAKTNWQKHRVSFAEAEMVFFDPLAIHDLDPDCVTEERFIAFPVHKRYIIDPKKLNQQRFKCNSQMREPLYCSGDGKHGITISGYLYFAG